MRFDDLISAYKRARHFAAPFDGPFCAYAREGDGPLMDARNLSFIVSQASDALEELIWFDLWALALNDYCDRHKVADDEQARWAFASFLSMLPIDPSPLKSTGVAV